MKKTTKIIIGAIIGIFILISGVYAGTLLKASNVSYKDTTVDKALDELINKAENTAFLKIYVNNEVVNEIPKKNAGYILESLSCDNDSVGFWNEANWNIELSNISSNKTSCTIKFKSPSNLSETIIAQGAISDSVDTTDFFINTGEQAGLYVSYDTNSKKGTFYYRGNVDYNYVSFAGFTWRIVRINEDGTIRIVLNEGINNNATYAYSSSSTGIYYSKSTAKSTLENWYSKNLSSYSDYISTGDYFCEESSNNNNNNNTVNFKCETDSSGYGIVNSNIGLLTYDEIIFAGSNYAEYAPGGWYLSSTETTQAWTMTPYSGGNYVFYIHNRSRGGLLYRDPTSNWLILMPVINLNKNVKATGTGTSADPYVITET
jgi:hypothetical protein